ncbi:MAG: ChbG/HpnK family deacetylase [Ramlibacter sp.]
MTTTIAVCIDDYGLHGGVDEAVLALIRQGRATATSCMTGAPAWRDDSQALAAQPADGVDVGLHLDFTEHPMLPSSRRTLPSLIALSVTGRLDREVLRAEIDAQLDAFESGMGRAPDYVDGHQHVHQLPQIRDVLVDALVRRYPDRHPWLRCTKRPAAMRSGEFKPWLIERLGCRELTALARAHGLPQNGRFLGVYDFQGDAPGFSKLLARWLEWARDGDVLMGHAATNAPANDAIGLARVREYAVLSGEGFGELLEARDIRLAPLSRIRAQAPVATAAQAASR